MIMTWKKTVSVFLAVFLAIAFMPAFVSTSHAADKFELEWTDVSFDAGSDANEWIFTKQDSVGIKDAVSEDESIATVTCRPGELVIYPVKEGSTNIIVTGENDQVINVSVSVTASYYEKKLKDRTSFGCYWYGSKKLYIDSYPGAEGTIKISKDTYKFTIGESGSEKIKLKKVYKLNTKIKATINYNGYTTTKSKYFFSGTDYEYVKASKHRAQINCFSLHKGDYVKVTYKGKTYKKKITKDYDAKNKTVTIKINNKLKSNSTITVKIVNKDKKTLLEDTVKLEKWKYYVPDEDEDEGEGESDEYGY